MFTRPLGHSGMTVSALGLGCGEMGGPFWRDDTLLGGGKLSDDEAARAVQRALDLGITLFDTSDLYGCGDSERLLGQALAGKRSQVIIATKFGHVYDPATRYVIGTNASPDYVRSACEASLRRLNIDVIDLYQLHAGNYDMVEAEDTVAALEGLVAAGKIRAYGWSTDSSERAALFARGAHCAGIQQRLNIVEGNRDILALCERLNLASIARSPLARGLLTGKFTQASTLPADDARHSWNLKDGEQALQLQRLEQVREVLTSDGRTLAQAALGWLWALSPQTIPIPAFKAVTQVEDNAGALLRGPLSPKQMAEIDRLLAA
jgi:aryl-alcohol dehydrogenase-like predicted oxidoreductase